MGKRKLCFGTVLLGCFLIWTLLIRCIDVQPIGPRNSSIGFAALNGWFHQMTGVRFSLYTLTDWLGFVPVAVCIGFGVLGLAEWINRRRIERVDADILLLGGYYILVILLYLLFEAVPVNYRPLLINGILETSYPSSTTLLVLSVMPTLPFQLRRRVKSIPLCHTVSVLCAVFSCFMVLARLVSGVHWLTDIVGAVLGSGGLFMLYTAAVAAVGRNDSGIS